MKKTTKKLGELALEAGLIDNTQLSAALNYQSQWGGRIGSILVKKGFVTEQELLSVVEKQVGIPAVSLIDIGRPPEDVMNLVRRDIARKFCIFPLGMEGKTLRLAMADPTDLKMIDDIQFMIGVTVKPAPALESDISRAIDFHYEGKKTTWETPAAPPHGALAEGKGTPHEEIVIERLSSAHKGVEEAATTVQEEAARNTLLEGLIDLLVAKGIITREELSGHIRPKKA